MGGEFVGIGVKFYMYKDSVAIIQPIANSLQQSRIKLSDHILYADKTKYFGRKGAFRIVCF
jgi:carboxyl-terminal processing protease